MTAVENQNPVAEQKRKRRWFRFRFGLRTLLLFMALVAVLLSFEAKRAADQKALVARVEELGGTCVRRPREWIPKVAHGLLAESQRSTVDTISVHVIPAPTGGKHDRWRFDKLAEPSELQELLRLPAMVDVRTISLKGTSVTDKVLDELAALKEMETIELSNTAVTEQGAKELETSLPNCQVSYLMFVRILRDGTVETKEMHFTYSHTAARALADDLSVFVRADRGDPEAVRSLVTAAAEEEARDYQEFLMAFLHRIDRRVVLPPVNDALRDGTQEERLLAVRILADRSAVDGLAVALHDSETSVRLEAVYSLADIGGEAAARHISDACRDTDSKVREAALRRLPAIAGPEVVPTYLAALKDSNADVRWQAIRAIEQAPDEHAVEPLIGLLADEKSTNRCSAARVLGKIADPRAMAALETAAAEDDDSFVREAAKVALAKIGAAAKE
jgi:HEAT repeat protein